MIWFFRLCPWRTVKRFKLASGASDLMTSIGCIASSGLPGSRADRGGTEGLKWEDLRDIARSSAAWQNPRPKKVLEWTQKSYGSTKQRCEKAGLWVRRVVLAQGNQISGWRLATAWRNSQKDFRKAGNKRELQVTSRAEYSDAESSSLPASSTGVYKLSKLQKENGRDEVDGFEFEHQQTTRKLTKFRSPAVSATAGSALPQIPWMG